MYPCQISSRHRLRTFPSSWRPVWPLNLCHSLRVTLAHPSLTTRSFIVPRRSPLFCLVRLFCTSFPLLIHITLSLGGQLVVSALTCMFSSHLPSPTNPQAAVRPPRIPLNRECFGSPGPWKPHHRDCLTRSWLRSVLCSTRTTATTSRGSGEF